MRARGKEARSQGNGRQGNGEGKVEGFVVNQTLAHMRQEFVIPVLLSGLLKARNGIHKRFPPLVFQLLDRPWLI